MTANWKHLAIWLTGCLAQLFCHSASGQKIIPYTGLMPAPAANKNMLFYLQRTIDINTLVYEINYKANGQIDKNRPVKIYWIRYTEGGKTAPLSYAQNRFAYGVESDAVKGPEPVFRIRLVSYKKIEMYLKPTGENGRYQAHILLRGKVCVLRNLLVHIIGGSYLEPSISHIEVTGKDPVTGEWIIEKLRP